MAIFVMVPGGWHGGWAFAGLAGRLRRDGHDVFTPTLTGLDEDEALRAAAPGTNLDAHISDICDLLAVEDLYEVVLVAHSYGGMVATGVADRSHDRIAALVYLDAFVPQDGQSWWDLTGETYRMLALARARHDGLTVLPPDHLDRRCAPHPLATFVQQLRLAGRERRIARRVFVFASGWAATPFRDQHERLKADPAWEVHEIDRGHDLMNTAPDEVMAILRRLVSIA
ncbi:MAG: alpha/beta hydrolase [Xanthobacteraceae bacterium]|nr:alpha/beta hydrolase [Xanthobacteraceae bacterium]